MDSYSVDERFDVAPHSMMSVAMCSSVNTAILISQDENYYHLSHFENVGGWQRKALSKTIPEKNVWPILKV